MRPIATAPARRPRPVRNAPRRHARRLLGGAALLAGCCLLAGCGGPGKKDIERLTWLSGCWTGKAGGSVVIEEQWGKPAGGTLLGTARHIENRKTVFHEYRHIGEVNDGLVYMAYAFGDEHRSYRLEKVSSNKAVFASGTQDFPQKLTYQRKGHTLIVLAEGTRDGREIVERHKLKRIPCD